MKQYITNSVLEVVRNYDIDSVHLTITLSLPVAGKNSSMMPHSVHTETGSAAKRIGAGQCESIGKDLSHEIKSAKT
ncbi:hypothetical protein P7H21_12675 [Paenibacillus larvae]|nr:hypothetical protein [Paenibacillus larvae]MDT2304636.1 hypothetical protein [Paenibacillus larvae]